MIRRLFPAACALLALSASSLGQSGAKSLTPIPMVVPKEVAAATDLGHLDGSTPLHVTISLPFAQPAAMQAFVDDVSNPKSPNYRHFITPAEVGSRFGQSLDTVRQVQNYLQSQGMTIRQVSQSRLTIQADATASVAEAAFHTTLEEYKSADGYVPHSGKLFAFTTPPSVPAKIAPYVISINGLESFTHPKALNYDSPPQLRELYDVAPAYTVGTMGEGTTIAISNWDGYRVSNALWQYQTWNIPLPPGGFGSNVKIVTIDGGSGPGGEAGEGDLDIQTVLSVAPLCNLIIYDGGDSLTDVLTQEADDNKADVLTESYGWSLDSATTMAAHNLHLQMNAQGQTYMAATGDSGTDIYSYHYPDIDPEVLLVGGTTANVNSNGTRSSEYAWSGGGGGWNVTSDSFNVLPSWQKGPGVPTTIPYRLVPDVADDADPDTGLLVYLAAYGGYFQIGGTSLASPIFASTLAYVEETMVNDGQPRRFGRINDLLYTFDENPGVFYDITSGSNGVLPNGQTSVAGPGWDFTTGLGAMDHNGFVNYLLQIIPPTLPNPGTLDATPGGTVSYACVATDKKTSNPPLSCSVSSGPSWISYNGSVITLSPPLSAKTGNYPFTITAVDTTNTSLTSSESLVVKVAPCTLQSAAFAAPIGSGGTSEQLNITLTSPAPAGGLTLSLTALNGYVSPQATVTIPEGYSVPYPALMIPLNSVRVPEQSGVVVSGAGPSAAIVSNGGAHPLSGGTTTKSVTATIRILPPAVTSLVPSSSTVTGSTTLTVTVTLAAAAPTGGIVVNLSSNLATVASVPSTVTVPAGSKTATYTVTTYDPTIVTTVTLSAATTGTPAATTTLTVNP